MSEYYMSHTGEELDDAINKVRSGYILPSETINIIENVSNMDISNGKFLNVNVPIPSGYIKASDTQNFTTKFASGTLSVSSDTRISNVSITVGFKPKIFVLRGYDGINAGVNTSSTASRYYIVCFFFVTDNNYQQISCKPDGSTNTYTRNAMGVYTLSSTGRSTQSNSVNNALAPTDTGVKGNGSTSCTMYIPANKTFFWYAWG